MSNETTTIAVGTILICVHGYDDFTKGKEYPVTDLDTGSTLEYCVEDDLGEEVWLSKADLAYRYSVKTNETNHSALSGDKKIKDCPFCGNRSFLRYYGAQATVGCDKCFISTLTYNPQKAIDVWNERKYASHLQQQEPPDTGVIAEELEAEINHIIESGANKIRYMDLFKRYASPWIQEVENLKVELQNSEAAHDLTLDALVKARDERNELRDKLSALEMQDCECGHTAPVTLCSLNQDGQWTCPTCVVERLKLKIRTHKERRIRNQETFENQQVRISQLESQLEEAKEKHDKLKADIKKNYVHREIYDDIRGLDNMGNKIIKSRDAEIHTLDTELKVLNDLMDSAHHFMNHNGISVNDFTSKEAFELYCGVIVKKNDVIALLESQLSDANHKLEIANQKVKLNYNDAVDLGKRLEQSQHREAALKADYDNLLRHTQAHIRDQDRLILDGQQRQAKLVEALEKIDQDGLASLERRYIAREALINHKSE